jgi:hypothetical protein
MPKKAVSESTQLFLEYILRILAEAIFLLSNPSHKFDGNE